MRGPSGLLAAALEIMGGDCLSIIDDAIAIPAPAAYSLHVIDDGVGVEEVRVHGEISHAGRTQLFTRFSVEDAADPARVLALGINTSVVLGPAPEGHRYVPPGSGRRGLAVAATAVGGVRRGPPRPRALRDPRAQRVAGIHVGLPAPRPHPGGARGGGHRRGGRGPRERGAAGGAVDGDVPGPGEGRSVRHREPRGVGRCRTSSRARRRCATTAWTAAASPWRPPPSSGPAPREDRAQPHDRAVRPAPR